MADEQNYWEYGPPPTLFDSVRDNFISAQVRKLIHFFVRLSFRYYHKFEIIYPENLSIPPGYILAANHASHLDTLAVFCAHPLKDINRLRPVAAKDYFFGNPFIRTVAFYFANIIPMDRQGSATDTIVFAGKKMREGNNLLIFPEGTRTSDGDIHSFRPGIGMLALKYKVPVIPLYIEGTFQSQKKGMIFPRPVKIKLIAGESVDYTHLEETKENLRFIASDLEARVRELKSKVGTAPTF